MSAARTTTDCPPETAFTDLLAGELGSADTERLAAHLEVCDACRALRDALAEVATNAEIARELLGRGAKAGAAAGLVGRVLDRRYVLLRLLGKGGMGEVYEARHAETGRHVAVKLIRAGLLARGEEAERRFRREAKAAGTLQSPHLVQALDFGEDAETGDLYLVMELLHGEDLQHLVDRVGPLPPGTALRVAAQALAGLARAHEAGIVHRDIKPSNLFLASGEDGGVTVKVLDFGIAKADTGALAAALTSGITRTDGLLGSPLYMSPEQMQNSKGVDLRTDLWSLGSALYCALAGRAPYRHVENLFELYPAVRAGNAPPLRALAPWVAAPVAEAVGRALAVAPGDRYSSAAAMREALLPLIGGDTALREEMLVGIAPEVRASGADQATREGRRPRLLALAAALAVVLLGAGAALVHAFAPATGPPGHDGELTRPGEALPPSTPTASAPLPLLSAPPTASASAPRASGAAAPASVTRRPSPKPRATSAPAPPPASASPLPGGGFY